MTISLPDVLCEVCQDQITTDKCEHCEKLFCTVCVQAHYELLANESAKSLHKVRTAVSDIEKFKHSNEARIQAVQDQCNAMRSPVIHATAGHIQDMQKVVYDYQHTSLDKIDLLQSKAIKQILTVSQVDQVAVDEWKDQINTLTNTLRDADADSQKHVDLVKNIEELKGEIDTSRTNREALDTSLPDISEEHCQGLISIHHKFDDAIQTNTDSSSGDGQSLLQSYLADTVIRTHNMSSTLSYYRAIGKPTYIISGIQQTQSSSGYLHVAVSPVDGVIYVTDFDQNSILRINDQGKHLSSFWYDGNESLYETNPRGVAVNGAGQVAVTANHFVRVFTPTGTFVEEYGESGSDYGMFDNPYGVAYGMHNEMYVADWDNNRVQVMDEDGNWSVHSVYQQGPKGVTVCPDGTMLVVMGGDKPEIWRIHKDGSKIPIKLVNDGITRDNGYGFSQTVVDRDGLILLADRGSHSIIVLDVNGTIHCTIGVKGSLPGQFDSPGGLALTKDGRLVVSEFYNRRIQIF